MPDGASAVMFPHAGIAPTTGNASVLIERLQRKALLCPKDADDILNEACAIEALWHAGRLPDGVAFNNTQLTPQSPAKPKHSTFETLYMALVGLRPTRREKCKISHPSLPGTFYYLLPNGALRVGPTKHQAVPLGEPGRQALLEKGLTLLGRRGPSTSRKTGPKRTLTLSDLETLP